MRQESYIRNSILITACILLTIIGALQAQAQDVTVASTSRSVGGRMEWTVFINASPGIVQGIRCVEYKLPATSTNPNRRVCAVGNGTQPFATQTTSWGTFEIPIRITFKDGRTRTLVHRLSVARSKA